MINHRLKVGLGVCEQLPPSPANDPGVEPETLPPTISLFFLPQRYKYIFNIKQKNLLFFKKKHPVFPSAGCSKFFPTEKPVTVFPELP